MKTRNLLSIVFLSINCTISSQIIHVPGDQPTIQAGINASNNGDTVLVADGNYYENIKFLGKAITLCSHFLIDGNEEHIDNTIIDGSQPSHADSAAVVMFINGEDTTSIISGFTITGGSGLWISILQTRSGGGIACWNSGATISHNKITENGVFSSIQAFGGGIASLKNSGLRWLVIDSNIISNNTAEANTLASIGGGVFTSDNAIVSNNTIEDNTTICETCDANGGGLGGYSFLQMEEILYFNDNIVRNNELHGYLSNGAGLYGYRYNVEFSGNSFSFNSCTTENQWWGAGANFTASPGIVIAKHNEFLNNSGPIDVVAGPGGGLTIIHALESKVVIDGNVFINNTAKHGGGFYAKNSYNLSVFNNLFSGNLTRLGGGIGLFHNEVQSDLSADLKSTTSPSITNNTFYNNHADETGGAIRLTGNAGEGLITFNNIFWENEAQLGGNDIYNNSTTNFIHVAYSNIAESGIYGNWSGDWNINDDPLFFAPWNNDFHLDQNSPCAGQGKDSIQLNSIWYSCPATDFEDHPRPMPETFPPDIGADEIDETVGFSELAVQSSVFDVRCYPNPVTSVATIHFTLPIEGFVNLEIHNNNGRRVKMLHTGILQAGEHSFAWDAQGLPEGMYLLRLEMNGVAESRKVLLLE